DGRIPGEDLVAVEDLIGRARAVEQADGRVDLGVSDELAQRPAKRREAEAAGDDHDRSTARGGQRPGAAEGAAQAEGRAGLELDERLGGRADRADRVEDRGAALTGDRDRNLADLRER